MFGIHSQHDYFMWNNKNCYFYRHSTPRYIILNLLRIYAFHMYVNLMNTSLQCIQWIFHNTNFPYLNNFHNCLTHFIIPMVCMLKRSIWKRRLRTFCFSQLEYLMEMWKVEAFFKILFKFGELLAAQVTPKRCGRSKFNLQYYKCLKSD